MELSNQEMQYIREAIASRLTGLRIKHESLRAGDNANMRTWDHIVALERLMKKFST